MASVFKRGGRRNRRGHYHASYCDEHGKRVERSTRTSDHDAARQIASKWEADVALRRQGVVSSSQARFADENRRPLSEHLAEYLAHCEHVGQERVHRANKKTQLTKLVDGIGATRLSDLEPNRVERYLAGLTKSGKSHRTHNQHRAAAVSFIEWCVEQGRIGSNVLRILPTLNEAKDRRRVRKALSEDELRRLLGVAGDRQRYYLFAYYTGLRVKACRAATWGDVDLDSATIRVKAANAKGKREDLYLNLHPKLVEELRKAKPVFTLATSKLFAFVPTVRTFHRDCERAKIDRYDDEGRQLDRHALRTTLGTHLARAGVLPQQAMRLLGHTDVRITMKHYTDLRLADTAKALAELPNIEPSPALEPQVARATGTTEDGGYGDHPQKRQQLGGFDRQGRASIGNVKVSEPDAPSVQGVCDNPSMERGLGAIRHPLADTDLLPAAAEDTVGNTRAIGAVG